MATITVSGSDLTSPAERTLEPQTITGAAVIGETLVEALLTGDNTIAIPPGAVAYVLIPPVGNVTGLKVRTNLNAADGGLPIAPADPFVHGLATGTTSLIVNAAATIAALTTIYFV